MSELTTLFKNTADAIRSKTGDTATMKASQFPAKIQSISVGISQDEADARYLRLSGGTMTGNLILNGAPTADNQAASKAYVDSKAGGDLTLIATNSVTYTSPSRKNPSVNVNLDYTAINPRKPVIFEVLFVDATLYSDDYKPLQVRTSTGDNTTMMDIKMPSDASSKTFPGTLSGYVFSNVIETLIDINGAVTYKFSDISSLTFTLYATSGYAQINSGTFTVNIYQ